MAQTHPNAEKLWNSFLTHCTKINNDRSVEDVRDLNVRQNELNFWRSLGSPAGNNAYNQAVQYDAQLAEKHAVRTKEDAVLVRALFDQAINLNVNLSTRPIAVPLFDTSEGLPNKAQNTGAEIGATGAQGNSSLVTVGSAFSENAMPQTPFASGMMRSGSSQEHPAFTHSARIDPLTVGAGM